MPASYLYETAITIDHELDEMRVDTTVRGMATALMRAGFRETGGPQSLPYRRFIGRADQLRFRKAKGMRPVRGNAAVLAARTPLVGAAREKP